MALPVVLIVMYSNSVAPMGPVFPAAMMPRSFAPLLSLASLDLFTARSPKSVEFPVLDIVMYSNVLVDGQFAKCITPLSPDGM